MNRALLTTGLAAMQVCWIYPWALLVARWVETDPQRPLLSALSMLALLVLGALATRVVIRTVGVRRAGQLTLIALGLLAALLAVRLDQYPAAGFLDWFPQLTAAVAMLIGRPTLPALALALALVLWWRGVQLGSGTPTLPDVDSAFRWNIGMLVAFALVLAVGTRPSQQPALEAQATPFVVGSFFVGLLTLALARLESLRTRTRALALNSQWIGVLIGVAGLLVLAALAVAQVLSFDLLVLATRPIFDVLGRVLLVLLYLIVIPLAYVIELLAYWLLSLFSPDPNRQPPEPFASDDVNAWLDRLMTQALPPEVLGALKVVGAVLLLAVALLLVARTVARWRPRVGEVDATLEERDSVFELGRLRSLLLEWLRGLLRRRAPTTPAVTLAPAHAPAETAELSNVRALYRHLLALGAPRRPAATPYEHLPVLERSLEPFEDLEHLTAAYVQVRYAEYEPSLAEVEALRLRLQRIQSPAAGEQ